MHVASPPTRGPTITWMPDHTDGGDVFVSAIGPNAAMIRDAYADYHNLPLSPAEEEVPIAEMTVHYVDRGGNLIEKPFPTGPGKNKSGWVVWHLWHMRERDPDHRFVLGPEILAPGGLIEQIFGAKICAEARDPAYADESHKKHHGFVRMLLAAMPAAEVTFVPKPGAVL